MKRTSRDKLEEVYALAIDSFRDLRASAALCLTTEELTETYTAAQKFLVTAASIVKIEVEDDNKSKIIDAPVSGSKLLLELDEAETSELTTAITTSLMEEASNANE